VMRGDAVASKPRLTEAMRAAQQIDDRTAQFFLLNALGWQAANSGQGQLAAQLLGAAETVGAGAGSDVTGPFTPMIAAAKESASEALGAARFEASFEEGKRLSRDTAVRLALGESNHVEVIAADAADAGPLAKRELEVARLIAEGLSNKQIGARLFIAEATVASHVRHIMDKLGVNARSQIAVWVASTS